MEFKSPKPRVIIGLGNSGKKYQQTYHNVGFLFVDYLKREKKAENFILIKPKTFMNESGKAVLRALQNYQVKPEEILVVHDDADIELGKFKLGFGRGAAGHHGVESIIKELGTKNFWRLRIGIRKSDQKAGKIVLNKITPADKTVLEEIFRQF